MDRYDVYVVTGGFGVFDNDDNKEVFRGTKTEVEDFLDCRENELRIKREKEFRKNRSGFFKFFAA